LVEGSNIRTQALLGTEFKRRYKEGENIDRIILATVTKVNYKYNTVDVLPHNGSSNISSQHTNEGRFSAKLPADFAGKTLDGNVFGHIKPIEVGTLVLIGFLEGRKMSPIVLSIYGRGDETSELARAPFPGADPRDEELKQVSQQEFKVYPSLTYENVDGHGNRTVSFTGKSFMVMNADSNKDLTNITDDGKGADYEDLPTSYYASGKLIEPKDDKAPVILFKHQGRQDYDSSGKSENDNNTTMLFLDQDGTYRTSVVSDEWRSYFEINNDGTIRLRRQNGSNQLGASDDNIGIDILEDGLMFYVGDKWQKITEDGSTGNLGLGGGGNAPDELLKDLKEQIDEQNRNILDLNTWMEQGRGFITMGTDLLEQAEDDFAKYAAQLNLTAEEISSQVSEDRINGLITDSMESYVGQFEDIADKTEESLNKLEDMVSDNVITPNEKINLSVQWGMIKAEYPSYMAQAETTEVATDNYTTAYNELDTYLQDILNDMENNSEVDSNVFLNNFTNYYNERAQLLVDIFNSLNADIIEAYKQARDAGVDANTALGDAAEALTDSSEALRNLQEIADDGVITPQEKPELKREYEQILDEWESYVNQAEEYEVDSGLYVQAKDNLVEYIEGRNMFDNMDEPTTVVGADLNSVFREYYTEQVNLLTRISSTTMNILTQFDKDFEYYNTQITETSREIELIAESVVAQGEEIRLANASISAESDRIADRVTITDLNREQNEENRLNAMGTNLFIKQTTSTGSLNSNTGAVEEPVNGDRTSNFISVNPATLYTATVFNGEGNNVITVVLYDSAKNYLSGEQVSGTGSPITTQVVTTPQARYARVSTRNTANVDVQFEAGTGTGFFMNSNEDLVANIEFAQEEVNRRQTNWESINQEKISKEDEARRDRDRMRTLSEDDLLTPEEYNQLVTLANNAEEESSSLIERAEGQNIVTIGYQGALGGLTSYVENLEVNTEGNYETYQETLLGILDSYHDERNTIYSYLEDNARQALEASQDVLDESLAGALESEKLARETAVAAEKAASNVAHMNYEIDQARQMEIDHLNLVDSIVQDSIVNQEEKISLRPVLEEISKERSWLITQANVYSLGTQDYENAFNQITSELSTITDTSNMNENTEVNAQTFTTLFTTYHQAKATLLDGILRGAQGEYEYLDEQANIAQREARRRDRELQDYRNAVKDSQLAIVRVEDKIEEITDSVPYKIQILSTNGITFKNRIINTKLKASLIIGADDVTDRVPDSGFEWTRTDKDGNTDVEWTEAHKGVGPEIHITHEDVQSRSTFSIEIFEEVEERG